MPYTFDIGELKTLHRRAERLYKDIQGRVDDTRDPGSHHILAVCRAALDRGETDIIILQNQSNLMQRQETDEMRERLGQLFRAITAVLKLTAPASI